MSTSAFIYVRISEDREGAGLGVDRQRDDCLQLAERLGWTVVRTYTDNDTSAYTGKPRKGYRAMVDALDAGEATGVLVWHTDRLHRSPVELEDYVALCERRGVVTHTAKAGPLDLASPSGRLVARQLGAVARYEVEHNVERIKSARLQAVKAGKWAGGRRPYGYEADGVTVRPEEARWALHAAEAVLAGASVRGVARELADAGVTTTTGRAFTPSAVRRVLLRPRTAGLMEHNGEVVGEAEWAAIVPVDTWHGVVAVLTDDRRRVNRGAPPRRLGSGLFLCGVCGATVRSSSSNGRRAYACSVTRHLNRHADPVEELVGAVVIERLRQPDAAELFAPVTPDTSGWHVEAAAIRARLDELARLYADGTVDGRQLAEGTDRLRGRLAEVEGQIAGAASDNILGQFAGREPAEVWDGLDLDRRRAVVSVLLTVTLDKPRRGRPPGWQPGQDYFDPASVVIEWKASG